VCCSNDREERNALSIAKPLHAPTGMVLGGILTLRPHKRDKSEPATEQDGGRKLESGMVRHSGFWASVVNTAILCDVAAIVRQGLRVVRESTGTFVRLHGALRNGSTPQ
jgi:hypothetical protein